MYAIGAGVSAGFTVGGLTNGFNGRRLTLLNNSGQVMTISAEDVGSAPGNRIRTEGDSNVTSNNLATFTLVYSVIDSRWHYLGRG